MGKYILEIGLVAGEDHLCNSCYFKQTSTDSNWFCSAAYPKHQIETKIEHGRNLLIRDIKKCPLIPVNNWISPNEENGFDLT